MDGRCSFADLGKLGLDRFAGLSADWRRERGWEAWQMRTAPQGLVAV